MHFYLNVLSNIILQNYYYNTSCLLIFTDDYANFNYKGPLPTVNLKFINNTLSEDTFPKYFGCVGILIKSKTPCTIFQNIENIIKHTDERFNERKYLIMNDESENSNDVTCIFKLEEIKYVANLLIITTNEQQIEEYENNFDVDKNVIMNLITHKYVGENHNETILLDKWFSCNESFLYNNNLFPNKLKNQQGRNLRLATFTYPPYTIPGNKMHNTRKGITVFLIIIRYHGWDGIKSDEFVFEIA